MSAENAAAGQAEFTAKDWLEDETGALYEVRDGEVHMMSNPTWEHQRIVRMLLRQLEAFFEGKPCEPFISPIGVRLFPREDLRDGIIVQPDLGVLCDLGKVQGGVVCGAPDLVIEVLSPGARSYDLNRKRAWYKQAGVKEYWAVESGRLLKWLFEGGQDEFYLGGASAESAIFPGLALSLGEG